MSLNLFVCLFYCFTSQVNSYGHGGTVSSPNHTFPGPAWTSSKPVLRARTFACNWQQPFLNDSAEGRRMTVEIISWSISTKVWDRAGIELATPGSAVRLASVCSTQQSSMRKESLGLFYFYSISTTFQAIIITDLTCFNLVIPSLKQIKKVSEYDQEILQS